MLLALSLGAYAEDLQLKYIRPSVLLGMFMNTQISGSGFAGTMGARVARVEGSASGIVPKGLVLSAFDAKGILRMESKADFMGETLRGPYGVKHR